MEKVDFSLFSRDPGVYLMKNSKGEVLYIGKAKNLQQRVKQYFLPGGDSRAMIPFLIPQVAHIDTIIVLSEKEALLLENTLIKQHKPKYNVLLKDDKTFVSLMLSMKHEWPRLKIVRYKGTPKEDGLYFGPYTNALAARQTFDLIARLFPLRQCSDEELGRRSRPCLLYGIKRCIAPCVGKCTKEEYDQFVQGTIKFLKGQDKEVLKRLSEEMEKASEALEFEKAAAFLKTIQQIEHVTSQEQVVVKNKGKDTDVLGLYREADNVILAQLLFRKGKLVGSEHYSFTEVLEEDEELLTSFILQHYRTLLPEEILVPVKLRPALSEIIETPIVNPQIGEKKTLLTLAKKNAEALFRLEKDQEEIREKTLLDLQETCKLSRYPKRIECFDTSNLSGKGLVASMAAYTDGQRDKKRKRLFKIRGLEKPDDYAALNQVLTRRLTRAKAEDDLPDLILVDGGRGHLNIALNVLRELDIASVDLLSIAKEEAKHTKGLTEERIFLPHEKEPLSLPPRSSLLFFLQQVRDEAHRTAISFQKKQRTYKSTIETLPGIGPVKQKRLLSHFGSLKRIREASLEELRKIPGLTQKDIEKLKQ